MSLCNVFVRVLAWLIIKVFFREVDSFGETVHVPDKGPVIFVCAPHANQFIDPLLVSHAIQRRIGFLAAKKSMDRKYVGMLIRAMDSIPVKRPQDYMEKRPGTITTHGKQVVGEGTAFVKDFQNASQIYAAGVKDAADIQQVVSDTEILLKDPFNKDITKSSAIKFVPKIEQSEVYDMVWDALRDGKCIGIFPEGGSHDRTSMLPLKAGVTIMALGAMAKYPDLDVKIVPCGLNYFHAHRFRSYAYVDFGDPISISKELVEKYKAGKEAKREACATLLNAVYKSLSAVTINVPDYDTLQLLRMVKHLYRPKGVKLSLDRKHELLHRLAEAYQRFHDNPKVVAVVNQVQQYSTELKNHSLTDHQVPRTATSAWRSFFLLIWRIIQLILLAILALPGWLLLSPVAIAATRISAEKAKEALLSSNVKIAGRDVLATWKVLVGLVVAPILWLLYTLAVALAVNLYTPTLSIWARIFAPIGTFLLLPWFAYITVRFSETAFQVLFSLQPLLYATCKCCVGRNAMDLQQQRKRLQIAIVQLINELGPTFYGVSRGQFEDMRIIHPDLSLTDVEQKQSDTVGAAPSVTVEAVQLPQVKGADKLTAMPDNGDDLVESGGDYAEERQRNIVQADVVTVEAPVPEALKVRHNDNDTDDTDEAVNRSDEREEKEVAM